jgi:UDP-N-acetylglucosamine--N-acetylmuramyl-(pentapeptide) pyrophosphoryl-undecaprenol N-acetylglucosamine transferase
MGTPAGMERKLVAQAGYPLETVNISGVRGKGGLAWLLLPLRLLIAFWQSTCVIFRVRPDVVFSMGGYVAFPGGMMAVLWGKPLVVHEPGATAGLANRALALVADRVVAAWEGSFEARGHASAIASRAPGESSGWARLCARRSRRWRSPRRATRAGPGRCACSSSAAASARRP